MITEQELRQMEATLMSMREQERNLLAQLEALQLNMRRQEGAILFVQTKLQQAAAATNGAQVAAQ